MGLPSSEEVRAYVLNYLIAGISAKNLDGAQINDNFDFLGAGAIDSIGLIEMIAAIEKHFCVTQYRRNTTSIFR
jgi:acyl carrier protein